MAVAKTQVAHHPQHYQLQTVGTESLGPATFGAGVANTTVSAVLMLPCNYKIMKVGIAYTACDSVAGTDLFNLVVGTTGAYTQGNVAGNDNSFAQQFQPGPLLTAASYPPPSPNFALGYPSNVALPGAPVFLADVPISNAAALAYVNPPTPGSGLPFSPPSDGAPNAAFGFTGFGWVTVATTGGFGIFLPADYDAVYPATQPLTLRVTTTVSTGSITNLTITLLYEPMYFRPAPPGTSSNIFPGIDF